VQTDSLDIGNNHQVLGYGYKQSGQQVRLFIYDPNHPGLSCEFSFDITDTSGEVHIACVPQSSKRIFCMFRIDGYERRVPVGGWTASSDRHSDAGIGAVDPEPITNVMYP
jgi:hypothetical protein